MANKALSLSELINDVANELRIAKSLSTSKDPVMEFSECELELQVNIAVEGNGGIKFWIIDIGGGAKKEKTHTIKVKFNSIETNRLAFPSIRETTKPKPITKQ